MHACLIPGRLADFNLSYVAENIGYCCMIYGTNVPFITLHHCRNAKANTQEYRKTLQLVEARLISTGASTLQ